MSFDMQPLYRLDHLARGGWHLSKFVGFLVAGIAGGGAARGIENNFAGDQSFD
jgi:hypothetical protein